MENSEDPVSLRTVGPCILRLSARAKGKNTPVDVYATPQLLTEPSAAKQMNPQKLMRLEILTA